VADPAPPPERPAIDPAMVPRITRMLVLGYHFERLVRDGKVKNYAEIAFLTGLTTARVTQLVNLTLLPPRLQEAILLRPHGITEPRIRWAGISTDWGCQSATLSLSAARIDL
jgi:hypothetical protein